MNTPLSQIIKRLAVLSQLANDEADYTKNLTVGPGQFVEAGSRGARDMMMEPSPVEAALKAFLKTLPSPHLAAITALMYAGRNGTTIEEEWESSAQHRPDAELVDAIAEKFPRMVYIDRAVEKAGGWDAVNGLPAKFVK